jgi:hypothetical protein
MSEKMKLMMYVAGVQAKIKTDSLNEELRNKTEKEFLEFFRVERADVAEQLESERAKLIELKERVVGRWKPERVEFIAIKKQIAEEIRRKKNERDNEIRLLVKDVMKKDVTKTPKGAWREFIRMVQSSSCPAFIFGFADGEVKYEHEDEDGNRTLKFFNRNAFNRRYYTIKKNA